MIRSRPSARGVQRRLHAANAAVHRDHQPHALGMQAIERRRLQPVAVAQPLGDEMDDVGAEQLERAPQDDRRRHAVDVVVAVNGDPLLAARSRRGCDPPPRPCRPARTDRADRPATASGTGARPSRSSEPADAQQPRRDVRAAELRASRVTPLRHTAAIPRCRASRAAIDDAIAHRLRD